MNSHDEEMMKKALELAAKGKGSVEPNPMVGAVIVKGGKIIGAAFHEKFGAKHAEINALREAGGDAGGATLFVTLEPCCHQGKTPPCTKTIIKAGIKKVVAAMEDPNHHAKGKGLKQLKDAGVDIEVGVLKEEACRLNAPYIKLVTQGVPYFTAKWAMSLDGKISTFTGDSKWITCEAARKEAHRLRSSASAIMVGINTVLADDPLLTVRAVAGRNPARIVVDSEGRLSPETKIVKSAGDAPVYIATTGRAPAERIEALLHARCKGILCSEKEGRVNFKELACHLGKMELTNVLIEGGGELLGSAFDEGVIDRVAVFIAPKVIGGSTAKTPVAGAGIEKIAEALSLKNVTIKNLDCDILIEGDILRER